MRFTHLLGGLILTGILAGAASAQVVPYATVVTQTDAEVRCKPGTNAAMYATNRLKKGDTVLVVEQRADGWLGIAPPPGSFSWINARFVTQVVPTQSNWMVVTDPRTKVPVIIGSALKTDDKRPTVEGAQLERGAQVHSIGPAKQDGDGYWLPIDPPAGEVRYLRAEAVQKPVPVQTVSAPTNPPREIERTPLVSVPTTPVAYSTFTPAPAPAPTTPPPAVPESLWSRAQQAERNGQITEAIQIYRQLYRENVSTNRDAADWANKRAAFLENGQQTPVAASPLVSTAPTVNGYPAYSPQTKFVPLRTEELPPPVQPVSRGGFANPTSGEKTSVQLASRVDPSPDDRPPSARLNTPMIDAPPASPATTNQSLTPSVPANQKVYTSGPGKLVRAAVHIGGQPTYRLLASAGNPTLYVTAVPGLDLEPFVDKNVELIGTALYRGEMRANHMQVLQVQPMPATP